MFINDHLVHNVTVAAVAIALMATAPVSLAEGDGDNETPFDEAHLFFEFNNTDGDLGIHALIDGNAWKKLEIEDPRERGMLKVYVQGRLGQQGLTEFFFESAEPTFKELPPEVFFHRFPEGEYEIGGTTLEGDELESEVKLTHLLPAPLEPKVNGTPAAEDCDAENLPSVNARGPVTISWDKITESHPNLGRTGEPIEVVNYEVVVEIDEKPWKSSTILPPSATSFEVPLEILALGEEVKFEVLVREASYNQTAVESCFEVE